jgi:predicted DNA-binding transcriptional regulator YafY
MRYLTRSRGTSSERDVSPLRIVHYRGTWYLDAWCHQVDALRRFALDAIEAAEVLEQPAKVVAMKTIESEFDGAYGIFSGKAARRATLVFDASVAPWVSREVWHADQRGRTLDDGRYELQLPYADDTELAMDVLRYGETVEVMAPAALRDAIRDRLGRALARYA